MLQRPCGRALCEKFCTIPQQKRAGRPLGSSASGLKRGFLKASKSSRLLGHKRNALPQPRIARRHALSNHKICHIFPRNDGVRSAGINRGMPDTSAGLVHETARSHNRPILQLLPDRLFLYVLGDRNEIAVSLSRSKDNVAIYYMEFLIVSCLSLSFKASGMIQEAKNFVKRLQSL